MKKMAILPVGVTLGLFGVIALLAMADWDAPPVVTDQVGYRGTGLIEVYDAEDTAANASIHAAPPVPYPLTGATTPLAGDVYENVQVLGHLPEEQFTRLMVAITEWVAPEAESCGYCHDVANMASDDLYTKVVARRMLQMTWAVNEGWTDHVQETGVTCYTCHRGNPVPENIWFAGNGPEGAAGFAADRGVQNIAGEDVGLTSLPGDLSPVLEGDANLRVHTATALPTTAQTPGIKETEQTYGLMVHMSESLGVGCTYCHNTRAFNEWGESQPQRVTAWHGIQMVRELNNEYLTSLQDVFPENRLGPQGDVAKTNCGTCHNGVNKPLLGAPMAADYPSLAGAPN